MKDYIIESITGQKRARSHVKAQSLDNLRARLIREGNLMKNDMVVIFSTNAQEVKPDTPFNKTGALWYDGYNQQHFWMGNDGKAKNVSRKTGKISAFKIQRGY